MKKHPKYAALAGAAAIFCTALCGGLALYRWSLMSHYALSSYDVTKMAGYLASSRILMEAYRFLMGWLGVIVVLLAFIALLTVSGTKAVWRMALWAIPASLAVLVLAERIASGFAVPSIVQAAHLYACVVAITIRVLTCLICATLYRHATAAMLYAPVRHSTLDRRTVRTIGSATLLYALLFFAICTLSLVYMQLFQHYAALDVSPYGRGPFFVIQAMYNGVYQDLASVAVKLFILLPVMLWLTARLGRLAAAISGASMTAASFVTCYLFSAVSHAVGLDPPGRGNYTFFLLSVALSMLLSLALALLIHFMASKGMNAALRKHGNA